MLRPGESRASRHERTALADVSHHRAGRPIAFSPSATFRSALYRYRIFLTVRRKAMLIRRFADSFAAARIRSALSSRNISGIAERRRRGGTSALE